MALWLFHLFHYFVALYYDDSEAIRVLDFSEEDRGGEPPEVQELLQVVVDKLSPKMSRNLSETRFFTLILRQSTPSLPLVNVG